jgi:hypothetical protein
LELGHLADRRRNPRKLHAAASLGHCALFWGQEVNVMDANDHAQFDLLRQEVRKDIELAVANFKIWLLVSVLSNVVLLGGPALYIFFNTSNTSNASYTLSEKNRADVEELRFNTAKLKSRITDIERHLASEGKYSPLQDSDFDSK